MNRLADLRHFYALLGELERKCGSKRHLSDLSRFRDWPLRGVYFFFEPSEHRTDSGEGLRVVRVGTHALGANSSASLAQRLRNHRGGSSGGGNHRGSIFRLLVGQAMIERRELEYCDSWGVKSDLTQAAQALGTEASVLKAAELSAEISVSSYIGAMPFLWLEVDDNPGPSSLRGFVERNSLALLSNYQRTPLDPPSSEWLGNSSDRDLVRQSGLWNQRHVTEGWEPGFLKTLEELIGNAGRGRVQE